MEDFIFPTKNQLFSVQFLKEENNTLKPILMFFIINMFVTAEIHSMVMTYFNHAFTLEI